MKCLWTSSFKVLEEMSESLKESFEVSLTSVLQSQFDGQCAVDDVNVGTVSSSFRVGEFVQSCEEDQFQSDWKELLQTKLTNETLIMRSNSINDQNSTPGNDELNDETIDAKDSEDNAGCQWRVTHARLVENRVTLQAPEPEFKSAGLHAFKSSCTDVMNFVTSTSELLSP